MRDIRKRLLLSLLGAAAALAIAAPAANAGLAWSEPSYDFGSHEVGSPAPAKAITLVATCDGDTGFPVFLCTVPGGGVHNFGLPAVSGEGFSLGTPNTCASSVLVTPLGTSPPATCVVTVNFTPGSAGLKSGSVTLPTGPDIALSGTGVAPPQPAGKAKKCKKKKKSSASAAKKKCKKKNKKK